jgi:hypothetical protein
MNPPELDPGWGGRLLEGEEVGWEEGVSTGRAGGGRGGSACREHGPFCPNALPWQGGGVTWYGQGLNGIPTSTSPMDLGFWGEGDGKRGLGRQTASGLRGRREEAGTTRSLPDHAALDPDVEEVLGPRHHDLCGRVCACVHARGYERGWGVQPSTHRYGHPS